MEENIILLHAKCVNIAIEMLEKHPYFILEELLLPMEGMTIPVLSHYENHIEFRDACCVATFHPRNGSHKSLPFGLVITKVREGLFTIAVGEIDRQHNITRLTETCTLDDYGSPVSVITLLFTTLDRGMAEALEYGWGTYRIPREWRKSYYKAIRVFVPEFYRKEWKDPAFYPKGTLVEFLPTLSEAFVGEVLVKAVAEFGPNNYIIHTDRYMEKKYEYIERRHSVNTGHVSRIIKRGVGPVSIVSTAEYLFQKELEDDPKEGVSFYACQKTAWGSVFQGIGSTRRHWHRGLYDLAVNYIRAFKPHLFKFSNVYQFDYYAFMWAVSEPGSGFGSNGKINKKRFKKQLKRIHCYFKKLSKMVEEDRRENDLMCQDLDL
jgi:hypothetical protein